MYDAGRDVRAYLPPTPTVVGLFHDDSSPRAMVNTPLMCGIFFPRIPKFDLACSAAVVTALGLQCTLCERSFGHRTLSWATALRGSITFV